MGNRCHRGNFPWLKRAGGFPKLFGAARQPGSLNGRASLQLIRLLAGDSVGAFLLSLPSHRRAVPQVFAKEQVLSCKGRTLLLLAVVYAEEREVHPSARARHLPAELQPRSPEVPSSTRIGNVSARL